MSEHGKEAVFTMKLEHQLRDDFMAEAQAMDRPASQIVREFMREFLERRKAERDRDALLRRKVEAARADVRAGRTRSNEEVEADFASRRASLRQRAEGGT
jgi:predicted transcriptional regulator